MFLDEKVVSEQIRTDVHGKIVRSLKRKGTKKVEGRAKFFGLDSPNACASDKK